MENPERIGIVGGTFNPIHNAHLIIAELFTEQANLDLCFFVPANISPFKIDNTDLNLATAEQRLEMVRLAISGNSRFELDAYELEKKGISYTYETVLYFMEKYPTAEIFLLIGTDQAQEFTRWNNWKKICTDTQLCIVQRPDYIDEVEKKEVIESLTIEGKIPVWISTPLLGISSTEIRKRISLGMTVKYMIPKEIEDYIVINNLYKM